MSRVISEWETYDNRGKAVVKYSDPDELFFIDYYDDHNHLFFTEDFPNKSVKYVEDAAENWVAGIKTLDIENV